MTALGVGTLGLFVAAIVASVRGWIPQRVLTLQTVLLLVAAVAILGRLLAGLPADLPQVLASMSLHPVTATIAGFLLGGALQAAGAFDAASHLLGRLTRTRLGLPFVVLLLVNLPSIFAMPCGRILAAPLMPLAILLGHAAARQQKDQTLVAMTVFGLVVNAAASCGPSLIGGIGMLGEGLGRYPAGSFANPSQMAILVITVACMALIKLVYGRTLRMRPPPPAEQEPPVPEHGYLALGVFVALLLVVVLLRPQVPLQTTLLLATLALMGIARLSVQDLLGGVMLHPLSAMIAGFVVAGALSASGAFAALEGLLSGLAEHTPLGYPGVAILVAYVPVMFAMPCGRILSISLVPGVLVFGDRLAAVTGFAGASAVLLSSFILSGAASCGPSAIGGIGNIGEGRLRIRGYWSGLPQAMAIFLGVPVSALLVSVLGLSGAAFDGRYLWTGVALGALAGVAVNRLYGYRAHHAGGLLGGAAAGALLALL